MSSSSLAKSGSVMHIPALPVPLSCTENRTYIAIIVNVESVFNKNHRLRVQIGLPPIAQPEITLQLDAGFSGGSYPI